MTAMYDVMDMTMRLVGPGEYVEADSNPVPEGKGALVLNVHGHDVAAFYGTLQQLRERVFDGLMLSLPEGLPIVDNQDATDAEHEEFHRRADLPMGSSLCGKCAAS